MKKGRHLLLLLRALHILITFRLFVFYVAQTWISCEERIGGNIWEVDPTGQKEPKQITMGDEYPGKFESFAFDIRDATVRFYDTQMRYSTEHLRRLIVTQTSLCIFCCCFKYRHQSFLLRKMIETVS